MSLFFLDKHLVHRAESPSAYPEVLSWKLRTELGASILSFQLRIFGYNQGAVPRNAVYLIWKKVLSTGLNALQLILKSLAGS